MLKNLVLSAAGLALLASPLAASAQTAPASTNSNAALIAVFTKLVQVLEQELQQLLGFKSQSLNNTTIQASPISGMVPLSVSFRFAVPVKADSPTSYKIDFGDATGGTRINCDNSASATCRNSISHTYEYAGRYTASLREANPPPSEIPCAVICADDIVLSSVVVTVTSTSSLPVAMIDQNILNFDSTDTPPTLSGSASGIDQISVNVGNIMRLPAQVINGHWSVMSQLALAHGSYKVEVIDPKNNAVLATGTLTIR